MNPFNIKEQAILLHALEALQRTTGITSHVMERELVPRALTIYLHKDQGHINHWQGDDA